MQHGSPSVPPRVRRSEYHYADDCTGNSDDIVALEKNAPYDAKRLTHTREQRDEPAMGMGQTVPEHVRQSAAQYPGNDPYEGTRWAE
jgi:hypothetical protein